MPKRNFIWILILLAAAAVLLLVWRQPQPSPTVGVSDFQSVQMAYKLLGENYYQPVDEAKLRRSAVRGMIEGLDEFSTYVPPERARALTGRVMGQACGLGLVLRDDAPLLPPSLTQPSTKYWIAGVLPNSPAYKAGIGRDATLLAIDGKETKSLNTAQVRSLLAGEDGSEVKLRIQPVSRKNSGPMPGIKKLKLQKPRTITLTRRQFPVETVQGLYRDVKGRWVYRLPGQEGIYYVRITEFCPQTPRNLLVTLGRVAHDRRSAKRRTPRNKPASKPASTPTKIQGGLILDLRDNPGGLLPDGVVIADMFLAKGIIVTVVGRGDSREVHHAHKDSPYEKIPLVVLINEKTVSAAELLAGALAVNARAVLVGSPTRGKGCVQTMLKLPGNLGQVNLTTARFFIDADKPIRCGTGMGDWSLSPDVKVKNPTKGWEKLQRMRTNLTLLPPPTDSRPGCIIRWPERWTRSAERLCRQDAQLARAIELLRSPRQYDKIIRSQRKQKTASGGGRKPPAAEAENRQRRRQKTASGGGRKTER